MNDDLTVGTLLLIPFRWVKFSAGLLIDFALSIVGPTVVVVVSLVAVEVTVLGSNSGGV